MKKWCGGRWVHTGTHLEIKDWIGKGKLLCWHEAQQSLFLLCLALPAGKDGGKCCEMGADLGFKSRKFLDVWYSNPSTPTSFRSTRWTSQMNWLHLSQQNTADATFLLSVIFSWRLRKSRIDFFEEASSKTCLNWNTITYLTIQRITQKGKIQMIYNHITLEALLFVRSIQLCINVDLLSLTQ